MIFAWDTETTGLVNNRESPDHPSQPHLVQLAGILYDEHGAEFSSFNVIVKPEGYAIPKGASDIHGITTERALEIGIPLIIVCALFSHYAKMATHQVGHNVEFDILVMKAAFARLKKPIPVLNPTCTKNLADPVLKLPPTPRMVKAGFGNKFKAPNLTECMQFFFNEDLAGAHDALVDCRACGRVLFELIRRGDGPADLVERYRTSTALAAQAADLEPVPKELEDETQG